MSQKENAINFDLSFHEKEGMILIHLNCMLPIITNFDLKNSNLTTQIS